MKDSDSREIVLDGYEADTVLEALRHHEPSASDANRDEIDDFESLFDQDLDDAAEAEFEITRGEARIVISALEERETLVDESKAERFAAIRGRFTEEFDFEAGGRESTEDGTPPGAT